MDRSTASVATLPKVELHVHLEGTLEPELIFRLAERNGIALPYDVGQLRSRYAFTNLQSFLDLYLENLAVLQTEDDFADLTRAYLERARSAGVRHAEIFLNPQAHTSRGVALQTCIDGVTQVLRTSTADYGISTGLIAAFLRDRPVAEALDTLTRLIEMEAPIIGVGLDSAEVGHPPEGFVELFDLARSSGLRCVAHAGEEGPPDYIWQALDLLHVERVDHGIRALEDPELVRHLVERGIPLTVCPLSNVALRAVGTLVEHPLPRMLQLGLVVTVNSDDPAYFGGYLDDNFRALAETFGLTEAEQRALAVNAVDASFLPDAGKAELLDEIARWPPATQPG
jgi:adenosine deaminase